MTNLPAPRGAFKLSHSQLRDSLEGLLRNEAAREQAFWIYAYRDQARDHFRKHVMACEAIDKHAVLTGFLLSFRAHLTQGGNLEVREALTKFPAKLKICWQTMQDRINILETLGLIEILEPGSRNGHPYHIRLTIKPRHHREIEQKAASEIESLLAIQDQSSNLDHI